MLAIVTHIDLGLHQINVKTAFVNGDLKEDIYMQQHVGFVVEGK